ncbi:uncharacterized protein LOC116348490 [Contarinia nasturtii]|uniref:uncharacterized protein LOC116348490 n=1 Tax=Contarinia nasturtii TaxID=265458 RepID=UPI0012D3D16B|nr:uncharacterized protein LOC116348490 [Contarinia nasturtii]
MEKEIPREQQTIVYAHGNAKIAANSPIKGHLRTPEAAITHTIDRYAMRIDINERGTSMYCSRCQQMTQRPIDVKVRKGFTRHNIKDRFLVCQNCESGRNAVLPVPREYTAKTHRSYRKKIPVVGARPKTRTFETPADNPNRIRSVVMDRDHNASRNMIYKAKCMLSGIPINPVFNMSAVAYRQQNPDRVIRPNRPNHANRRNQAA